MRGPSYTKDEITLLHSLHAKYGGDWADIQRVFSKSPSFKRSIKSLQSRYYLKQKQSQNEEKVRPSPPLFPRSYLPPPPPLPMAVGDCYHLPSLHVAKEIQH